MDKAILTATTVALLSSTAAGVADPAANKDIVMRALQETLGARDPSAVDRYFGPDYIQHNAMASAGVAGLKELTEKLNALDSFSAEPVRVIGEGDLVAVHGRYVGLAETPLVAFDVFRLANGRIVEHWDNLTPEQGPNPSGHSQLDGETAITDRDLTEANKATVVEFVTRVLIAHEEVDVTDYISPVSYVQHNSMVADGIEGFGAFLAEMGRQDISMSYERIHLVVAEGNFVLTASEGSFGDAPKAFYDLFRLEDGLIVEHWDVIDDMPDPDAAAGYAGKF